MKNEESEKKNLLTNQSSASENEEDEEEKANEIKEITSPNPTKELDTASLKHTTPVQLKVYPQRWLMLAIFSLTTLLNGSMFMGLSAVVAVTVPYYQVTPVSIQWLSNMFMLIFVFVSMPSAYAISKYGVRFILSLAAGLDALGTLIQYFGSKRDAYMYVVIGQNFGAIAYGSILIIPGNLSFTWFPPQERGMSTSIGVFMNILGFAVGFVQPSYMIPVSNSEEKVLAGLNMFFSSRVITAFVILLVTLLLYRENPPTPASYIEGKRELGFFESLKILYYDSDFHLMAQAYGIYFGLFVAVSVIISQFVIWIHGAETRIQHLIGWMGFTCDIAAIVSCLVIGFYLDRYARHKAVAVFLNAGSALLWLGFSLVLTRSKNFDILFAVYVVYGTMGIPYFASGVEQAAEMTSPVPESTSSAVILLLGNLYGFIFIFVFGALIEYGYPLTTLYLILGLYVTSTALVGFSKVELKRLEAESTSTFENISVSPTSNTGSVVEEIPLEEKASTSKDDSQ